MILKQHILRVAALYRNHFGLENKTVSFRVFNDSSKLEALIRGADLQTARFETAMRWFSDNWPEGVAWPDDVPRPPAFWLSPTHLADRAAQAAQSAQSAKDGQP